MAELGNINAKFANQFFVKAAAIAGKYVAYFGLDNQPRIFLNFTFQLARPPSGIAQHQPHILRAFARGGLHQNIEALRHRDLCCIRLSRPAMTRLSHKSR